MRHLRSVLPSLLTALFLSACANAPKEAEAPPLLSFAPYSAIAPLGSDADIMTFPGPRRGLAGRTLQIASIEDIVLMRNEVVLTFDDGPVPGRTTKILDALDRHGARATFLMVGRMARNHPDLAREVAERGHTIGSHTHDHPNLAGMNFERATAEIRRGADSVAAALAPSRHKPAPFFRFPYLADTPALRRHMAMTGNVVVDVDVDSKDYFQSTPDQVRRRTLARLKARGSGIILFHDLHHRTANMLPAFLDDLKRGGYKVVHIVPRRRPAMPELFLASSQAAAQAPRDRPLAASSSR